MGILEQLAEIKAEEARKEGEKKLRKVTQEKDRTFVESLLIDTKFGVEKIANLTKVPVDFVQQVKKGLSLNR